MTIPADADVGERHFHGPDKSAVGRRPRLELTHVYRCEDRSCDVTAAVPVQLSANDTCRPFDAAAKLADEGYGYDHTRELRDERQQRRRRRRDRQLWARSSRRRHRDGVCVAVLDPPNELHATCIDTRTAGAALSSWPHAECRLDRCVEAVTATHHQTALGGDCHVGAADAAPVGVWQMEQLREQMMVPQTVLMTVPRWVLLLVTLMAPMTAQQTVLPKAQHFEPESLAEEMALVATAMVGGGDRTGGGGDGDGGRGRWRWW